MNVTANIFTHQVQLPLLRRVVKSSCQHCQLTTVDNNEHQNNSGWRSLPQFNITT